MKKFYLIIAVLLGNVAFSQQGFQEQINELKEKSDKFNVFLNFQSSFDAVDDKQQTQFSFKARQLRLEFRGDINEKIFYRLRHRLNKNNAGEGLDNLAKATDLMYAGIRLDKQWTLTFGKMCQAWGGFEFDLNPMNIYEYSDFVENMDNFMLGAMLTYNLSANHEFNFQVTNSRNETFGNLYPTDVANTSNSPLTYIFNWNGNLLNNVLQTRWGIGYEQEAKNYASKMVMLGTRLNLAKFQAFFDYMYANQDLDRLSYASITPSVKGLSVPSVLKDTKYNSFVTKIEYQPSQKWNLFGKFMYETARTDSPAKGFSDAKRDSFGYFLGMEYLPFEDQDLRFFATFIARTQKTIIQSGGTNRFSIGMMYRIKAF